MADSRRTVRKAILRTPPHLPTFDCDEIIYIERMGDRIKIYFAGSVPVSRGGHLVSQREAKMAMIWPVAKLAEAIRQVEAAAAAVSLLTPEDYIGKPQGEA